MSDAPKKEKKKGGKGGLIIMLVGGLVLAGGGAAGGFFFAGKASASSGGGEAKHEEKAEGKPVKYFEVEKGFTSNLKEPDRYVELSVGVSTSGGDEKLGEEIKGNDMAIRSAVLSVLSEQSADQISTLAGKQALQQKLKATINDTLKSKTGKGGIDDVYFTNFILQ